MAGLTFHEAFVPTPDWLIDRKLDLAQVTGSDIVFDLGCGDGRVLVRAATRCGAAGVGYEVRSDMVDAAERAVNAASLAHRIAVHRADYLDADLSTATVVMLYLNRGSLGPLAHYLSGALPGGSRIVTHDFDLPGWEADRIEAALGPDGVSVPIFRYVSRAG